MSIDPPLVVELFGQPGSGKTTLAYSVATGSKFVSRSSLGTAWQRQSKLVKAVYFARTLLDVRCLAHAAKFVIAAPLVRRNSLSRLFRLLIKSHWIRSQTGPLLLSEGHLQELWSILYSAGKRQPEPRQLAPLIRSIFRGVDVHIVYLDLDPQSAFDRIRGRQNGKSRLDRLAELELRQHLAAAEELPHRIVDAATMAGLRVERLDASLTIETMIDRLHAVIRRLERSTADPLIADPC